MLVTSNDNLPKVKHWAILVYRSIFIPGDERSKQYPGHGYPERYEPTLDYYAYLDEKQFNDRVKYHIEAKHKFSILHVTPGDWSVTADVKINLYE